MIIEVESDQFIVANSTNQNQLDPLAMNFGSGRGHTYQGTTGRGQPYQGAVGRGQPYKGKKPLLVCDWCKKNGHTKEHCWKIIDYPNDGMDKRKGNTVVNNITGSECSYPTAGSIEESTNELGERGVSFNEEQYKQLLGLLNNDANNNNAQQSQGCYNGNMIGSLKWQGQGDW
ncbi:uncharacterized protein [Solanum tuberosum]|uniref:uncharacterized protein n=1 Tax=Solanum tuberosum TaxID=4113 RepID=UPI00073A14F8|nr:PREDICTED: uncharacterized protein LOC107061483 [Solanum tuberosum]